MINTEIVKIIVHWLHLCCGVIMLGGMSFATFVVIPSLKQRFSREETADLLVPVVLRFRKIVKGVLAILLLTGVISIVGLVRSSEVFVGTAPFWVLVVKLAAVVGIFCIFALAPRLTRYTTYCSTASKREGEPLPESPSGEDQEESRDIGPVLHYIALSLGALILLCAKIVT